MPSSTTFASAIAVALAASASLVSAHGRLQVPTPLKTDFEQLQGNNICGRGVNLANGAAAATFAAGATQSMTWFVLNGDGAGPLQVRIDPTGTGQSFTVDATITKQVPGENGNIGNSGLRSNAPTDFEIQVPNVACTGANGCLMQVKQERNGGFGSCAFVQITGATGGGAAAPAPAPAPAAPAPKANNAGANQGQQKNNNQGQQNQQNKQQGQQNQNNQQQQNKQQQNRNRQNLANKGAPAAKGAAAGNLGSCNPNDAMIVVGLGADPAGDRANEVRAVATGRGPFTGQQSALNTQIVGRFICNRLGDQCRADAAVVAACNDAVNGLGRGGRNLGAAELRALGQGADAFNAVLGARTNFAEDLVNGAGGSAGAAANQGAQQQAGQGAQEQGNQGQEQQAEQGQGQQAGQEQQAGQGQEQQQQGDVASANAADAAQLLEQAIALLNSL
ncbi:hypothetical protein HDU96_008149 [Phlyctochytrium bullatum]|nr:hypothetical protein HDU96_008149 [Phlyctochytrium bullatum]